MKGLAVNADQRRVLARMLACLATLGPEVIAEGVETEDDASVLVDMGIRLAQGFLWGRPEPV